MNLATATQSVFASALLFLAYSSPSSAQGTPITPTEDPSSGAGFHWIIHGGSVGSVNASKLQINDLAKSADPTGQAGLGGGIEIVWKYFAISGDFLACLGTKPVVEATAVETEKFARSLVDTDALGFGIRGTLSMNGRFKIEDTDGSYGVRGNASYRMVSWTLSPEIPEIRPAAEDPAISADASANPSITTDLGMSKLDAAIFVAFSGKPVPDILLNFRVDIPIAVYAIHSTALQSDRDLLVRYLGITDTSFWGISPRVSFTVNGTGIYAGIAVNSPDSKTEIGTPIIVTGVILDQILRL